MQTLAEGGEIPDGLPPGLGMTGDGRGLWTTTYIHTQYQHTHTQHIDIHTILDRVCVWMSIHGWERGDWERLCECMCVVGVPPPCPQPTCSWLGLTNSPRFPEHLKYSFPFTEPLFLPWPSSSSTPTHFPGANSVLPTNLQRETHTHTHTHTFRALNMSTIWTRTHRLNPTVFITTRIYEDSLPPSLPPSLSTLTSQSRRHPCLWARLAHPPSAGSSLPPQPTQYTHMHIHTQTHR